MNDQMAFNRPLSINWNSYLAPGLGGIKQNKCIIHCWTLRWFILFYSIKLRSQVWKLVSVFKASPPQSSLHLSQLHFDENLGTHGCLLCLRDMKLLMERTGGHFVCACVNRGCWSATEALSVNCLCSVPAFSGCFLELNDVHWMLRSTNMLFKVSRYFYDESEPLRGQSFLS